MPWGSGGGGGGGGVPVSHNALQHFPECHGAAGGGGYPARSSQGGTQSPVPPGGVPKVWYPPWGGYLGGYPRSGTPPGGYLRSGTPWGGYPGGGYLRSGTPWGVPGGYPRSGTPPGGVPGGVPDVWYPPSPRGVPGGVPEVRYPPRGGTQLGQHREYLLHSGRYASCVHAGGLSCSYLTK